MPKQNSLFSLEKQVNIKIALPLMLIFAHLKQKSYIGFSDIFSL